MRAVLALAASAVVGCTPVAAQPICMYHPHMIEFLADRHGEARIGLGLGGVTGDLYEFFRNPETGSFSVVHTTPDLASCIVIAGEGWQDISGRLVPGEPS